MHENCLRGHGNAIKRPFNVADRHGIAVHGNAINNTLQRGRQTWNCGPQKCHQKALQGSRQAWNCGPQKCPQT
ncbi:MAG: hypothetical protein PHP76_04365 [Bacteroidales bacterium]|nr:hypothetical protein [Bacteroidales bacterium]